MLLQISVRFAFLLADAFVLETVIVVELLFIPLPRASFGRTRYDPDHHGENDPDKTCQLSHCRGECKKNLSYVLIQKNETNFISVCVLALQSSH